MISRLWSTFGIVPQEQQIALQADRLVAFIRYEKPDVLSMLLSPSPLRIVR